MTLTTWADVRPGTILTVKHLHRTRPFKLRVSRVSPVTSGSNYAFIVGERLRMDGTRSGLPGHHGFGPGLRQELVYLGDVRGQAWDLGALQEAAAQEYSSRRRHNADGRRARGTSNGNSRGGSADRRRRKLWLLEEFGDGSQAACSFGCGTTVTMETITVDRFPVPGCQGGTYARGNIRPACRGCNSSRGAVLRRH